MTTDLSFVLTVDDGVSFCSNLILHSVYHRKSQPLRRICIAPLLKADDPAQN